MADKNWSFEIPEDPEEGILPTPNRDSEFFMGRLCSVHPSSDQRTDFKVQQNGHIGATHNWPG